MNWDIWQLNSQMFPSGAKRRMTIGFQWVARNTTENERSCCSESPECKQFANSFTRTTLLANNRPVLMCVLPPSGSKKQTKNPNKKQLMQLKSRHFSSVPTLKTQWELGYNVQFSLIMQMSAHKRKAQAIIMTEEWLFFQWRDCQNVCKLCLRSGKNSD